MKSWVLILCCSLLGIIELKVAAGQTSNQFQVLQKKRQRKKRQTNEITQQNSELLTRLLEEHPAYFGQVLKNADRHRLQIIFTQIDRDKKKLLPILTHHTYRLDTTEYFFPASVVKLFTSACALEKLHDLNIPGLDKYTRMEVGVGYSCQQAQKYDNTSPTGYPNIAHYIKKCMVVSDNPGYDHLYEFLGQQELNQRLWTKGYRSCRILQRYGVDCNTIENRYTNPIRFYQGDSIIYFQPQQFNPVQLTNPMRRRLVGKAYYNEYNELVSKPFDMSYANCVSLKDIHEMLIAIVMPVVLSDTSRRFRITTEDHMFLLREMSRFPAESQYPRYNTNYYHDGKLKYLYLGGSEKKAPANIRIFNKVGMSSGFITDCAYFVDFENKVEFLLSCTMYCNSDEIIHDDKYDYETVGLPFMGFLGKVIYAHEKERKRKYLPTLRLYTYDYGE
jgi:hypothetical protein